MIPHPPAAAHVGTIAAQVGRPAPAFALPAAHADGDVEEIALADYAGKWLALAFYPRDFSFVCPTELTALSAVMPAFEKRNCRVLGVSIDSIQSHLEWLTTTPEDGGVGPLRFPLAADVDGAVCRSYGVWDDTAGLPNRGLFLIDGEGVIRYAVIHSLGVGRNVDETLRVLDALISGGLCPASWTRADGTLDVASLLKPRRVLGHFRIEQELGRGGFGVLLKAWDLRLERSVALKVLAVDAEVNQQRLLAEARAAAGISHPNVCAIHSVEEIDGLPVIVMEHIDGDPLFDVLARRRLAEEFGAIAPRLAVGLAAAHACGITHGDLKPANILLHGERGPVIIDFGLARVAGKAARGAAEANPPSDSDARSASARLAAHDLEQTIDFSEPAATIDQRAASQDRRRGLSGTPAYMSPEQARGEEPTAASDVFSLGLIFAEMLTGKAWFAGAPIAKILSAVERPDLGEEITKGIPEEYRPILADMLAFPPGLRPTAAEVAGRFA